MKRLWLVGLLGAAPWLAPAQEPENSNVNSRYTVEKVEIQGISEAKLSKSLRTRMDDLVGQKFSQEKVRELARLIRHEFPGRRVKEKVVRGIQLDHVKVIFELSRYRHEHFDVAASRGIYHSREGWTGDLNATFKEGSNALSVGIVSDADQLLERFAGLKARYENRRVGSSRVRLAFQFETYHEIWNRTTLAALESEPDVPGIYRRRINFQPQLTVVPARGLRLSFGASLERFQTQYPAARTESASALIGTLRYDRSLEDSASNVHRFEAGYSLRAATRALDSDYVYSRNLVDFRYTLSRHRDILVASFLGGMISGRAPLFERFTLGNTQTLRGWNKFDVAPAGGNRVAHGSVETGHAGFRVFYDVGTVWTDGREPELKHSAGVGYRHGDFFLALAFPLKTGRADPIFMTGLNF